LSTDDVILQRVVPLVLCGVEDPSASIKSTAIRVLRALLLSVRGDLSSFNSAEVNIFPLYIFPVISRATKESSEILVRVALAECLSKLAETSKRFLDQTHFMNMKKSISNNFISSKAPMPPNEPIHHKDDISKSIVVDFPYGSKLEGLKDQVSKWIRDLIIDSSMSSNSNNPASSSSIIKQIILADIMPLCVFFGQESAMEKLLTQLLTFLNDPVFYFLF
jgi:phosphoinositide-3-kinase regulatory subunit 4